MIIYFHVGYPKCASTFMQKEIFTKLNKIKYLGRPPIEIEKIILQSDDIDF